MSVALKRGPVWLLVSDRSWAEYVDGGRSVTVVGKERRMCVVLRSEVGKQNKLGG